MRYGALEAGGTKMICAIGNENFEVLERVSIPTTTPDETLQAIAEWFQERKPDSLGIATFGPVDLNPESKTYGLITTTPKPGWKNAPIFPFLRDSLNIPVAIDTDVNAAAISEWSFGAAKGKKSCIYITVGTGIGAGIIAEGKIVHGLIHPEFGHILLRPSPKDPKPEGFCPFHNGCLEGLACGKSVMQRWGKPAFDLPADHVAWEIESDYLAQMCHNAIMSLSVEKIIIGGGVLHNYFLFPMIRQKTLSYLANYVDSNSILDHIDEFIVPPALGDNSGIIGAMVLAKQSSLVI